MLYQVVFGAETIYQGFGKYEAAEIYNAAVDAGTFPVTAFFDGCPIDHFDPFDPLHYEDPWDFGDQNWDDFDGVEFL